MKLFDHWRRPLAHLAMALMLIATLPVGLARAGLVPTDQVIAETFDGDVARDKLAAFVARDDVRRQLAALGVPPAEAEARIAALSDAELEAIAGQIDELPAGEGILTTAAIVAGVLLIVLIITDLAGITNVFTFIK
jgi:hypothetical protein